MTNHPNSSRLVLCRSDAGDGGWSLHAPGATDADIADGSAPPLVSGPAEWDDEANDWSRPNAADYEAANHARHIEREIPMSQCFRSDNTEGYSPADLDALNDAFTRIMGDRVAQAAEDLGEDKSYADHVAEQLLADYDAGLRGDRLIP